MGIFGSIPFIGGALDSIGNSLLKKGGAQVLGGALGGAQDARNSRDQWEAEQRIRQQQLDLQRQQAQNNYGLDSAGFAHKQDMDRLAAGNTDFDRRAAHANSNALNPLRRSLLSGIAGKYGLAGPVQQGPINVGPNPLQERQMAPNAIQAPPPPPPPQSGGGHGFLGGALRAGLGLAGAGVLGSIFGKKKPPAQGGGGSTPYNYTGGSF